MQIIANKSGLFGTKKVQKGDVIVTNPAYAKIWVALGHASWPEGKEPVAPRVDRTPYVAPTSAFDNPGAESDADRHARLLPEAVFQPGAELETKGNVGAMSTANIPIEGEVKTPESEAEKPAAPEIDETPEVADVSSGSEEPADSDADELKALRAEYEELYGKKPYMGWKAEQVREKIAEKKAEA